MSQSGSPTYASAKAGSFTKSTGAATASQSVTGVAFRPNVVLLTSVQDVAQTVPVTQTRYGFGAADGSTAGSAAFQDADTVNTMRVDGIDKTSKVFDVVKKEALLTFPGRWRSSCRCSLPPRSAPPGPRWPAR